MGMQDWWNDNEREKPRYSETTLSLCPPQIPHGFFVVVLEMKKCTNKK